MNPSSDAEPKSPIILDIGGEGRNPEAWNVNPQRFKTIGPERGQPIPRLICARGESIPFADQSVDVIIVERTPLRQKTLAELSRIAKPGATIILRHARPHHFDPHRFAVQFFSGTVECQTQIIGNQTVQETIIRMT